MLRFLARLWPIIAVAFPVLELLGIIRVWHLLGVWTLAWLLLSALAGSAVIAVERTAFLPVLAASVLAGNSPLAALMTSSLRFLAGLLLILPGALSDVLALLLLLWAGFRPATAAPGRPPERKPGDAEVIEGDYRRID